MPSLHLRTRRSSLFAVVLSVAASVTILGGTAGLFSESGRTPTFAAGSHLAMEAGHCPGALSQARHDCLRELVARQASQRDRVLVAHFAD